MKADLEFLSLTAGSPDRGAITQADPDANRAVTSRACVMSGHQ